MCPSVSRAPKLITCAVDRNPREYHRELVEVNSDGRGPVSRVTVPIGTEDTDPMTIVSGDPDSYSLV